MKNDKWKMVIRELLENLLWSQKDLAVKCGVSAQTVSNWLNDVRNPGVFAKRKLLQLLREEQNKIKNNSSVLAGILEKNVPDEKVAAKKDDVSKLVKMFMELNDHQKKKLLQNVRETSGVSKRGNGRRKKK